MFEKPVWDDLSFVTWWSNHQKIGTLSGVVVPRELGILLIYAPNFFFNGSAKDERPVS